MPDPMVSVVMPVYNTSAFLDESVRSVLAQSFTNFEYIIINDGSTDNSAAVIRKYNDPRIVYLENEKNMGLVYTLNRGVKTAKGEWIARIDGDDVCEPGRLEKQVAYLQQHPDVDVLATRVQLIDEEGKPLADWKDDAAAITPEQIRNYLPVNNCIAHPSVMARATVLRDYGYAQSQSQAEDYDLWLRLAADGKRIHKLDEKLVQHRIVRLSYTRTRQQNVFRKLAETKKKFVAGQKAKGNYNAFVKETAMRARIDQLKAFVKNLKG